MSVHAAQGGYRPQVQSVGDGRILTLGDRIRYLKHKCHELFVEARHLWHLYEESKATIPAIAGAGEELFNDAGFMLEMACTGDQEAFKDAVKMFAPKAFAERQARIEAEFARLDELRATVKAVYAKRPDIRFHAQPRIREIARKGGQQYEELLNLLQYVPVNPENHTTVMAIFFPDAQKKLGVQPVKQ